MSGHSHWAGIKHKKEKADQKKGKIFSYHSATIYATAKGNPDTLTNAALRAAIEKAKTDNMPKENIERALEKARGASASGEEVTYEIVGPYGSGLLLEVLTDNKNRTLGEIKIILRNHDAQIGSVSWMFSNKKANYPLTLKNNQKQKILQLVKSLKELDEVKEVYHNI